MKYTPNTQAKKCAIYIKNTVHCTGVNQSHKYQFHIKELKYDF